MRGFEVERAGFLTTVQDLGRAGHRASGVSLGGALDLHSLRVANLLVGNEERAAGLEATLGTVRLRLTDDRLVAWCGGPFAVRIGETPLPAGRAGRVRAGEEVSAAAPPNGARIWLAISGGIEVPLVLGSRSTDLRGHFGGLDGRSLRDGDRLLLGKPSTQSARIMRELASVRIAAWSAPAEWANTAARHPFLRVVRGTDWNRFNGLTIQYFTTPLFSVSADSDRVGVRLQGPAFARRDDADLLSEPVAPGTIQVPPNGEPILLLGDCQTLGGYPKIAHVVTVDLPAAAQLRPGDAVRFAEISLAEAQQLLSEREEDVQRFRVGLFLQSA